MLEILSIFYDAKLLTMHRLSSLHKSARNPNKSLLKNVQLGSFFSISQLKKSSSISKEVPLQRKDKEREREREKAKINEQAYTWGCHKKEKLHPMFFNHRFLFLKEGNYFPLD